MLFRAAHLMALLSVFAVASASAAYAAKAKPPCPDDGRNRKFCTKEIRIWNNTPGTIYVILQGSIQKTDALNCPLSSGPDGGGDVWLQAALGDTTRCFRVRHDYYVYVNPRTGIPPNSFVSLNVPWWSKRAPPDSGDAYIDWWRGGRVVIFDDKNALNDSYSKLNGKPEVVMASGSPTVTCRRVANNACNARQLQIFEVTPEAAIAAHTPFQLNEFTFADVKIVSPDGKSGGEFIGFNQNYNVSNVDQVYLPIAIEPVREPADIGYMGTIMSVDKFRKQLEAFTGADVNPANPAKWPIYNNPTIKGKPLYPNAGIRVPSTLAVFNYYMNPSTFRVGNQDVPEIIPAKPPQLVQDIMDQWTACTTTGRRCPQSKIYQEINAVFAQSYAFYIAHCNPPDFLKPVAGTNPPAPTLFAYLRFVHGWVPFNTGCAVPELPTADQPPAGSRAPVDYIKVQYNYEIPALNPNQWFNPYTQFIHGDVRQGGLSASAYAFSIDDHASFQNNSGGSLSGGLIIAVGGDNGLQNKTQMPPPVPPVYKYFTFTVALGAPPKVNPVLWDKYGICNDNATTKFPPVPPGFSYNIGVDPSEIDISLTNPCLITLTDTNNRKYQFNVLKAGVPPKPIWPDFAPLQGFDPKVLDCPAGKGIVPPGDWCVFTNETSKAGIRPEPPQYSLSTRQPIQN
jgi:hypothetical protein